MCYGFKVHASKSINPQKYPLLEFLLYSRTICLCARGDFLGPSCVSWACDGGTLFYWEDYKHHSLQWRWAGSWFTAGSGGAPQSNPITTESVVTTSSSETNGKPNSCSVITLVPLTNWHWTLLSNITAAEERAMLYNPYKCVKYYVG